MVKHPIEKDSFWKRALNNPIEAGSTFEFVGSKSTIEPPDLQDVVLR